MVVKVYILHQHTYRPRTYALTLILLFLFFEICANDQLTVARSSIVGSIVDKNNEGIPFANIFLLSAIDSSFVKGSIADDLGHYSIPDVNPGHYFIECSVIGFSVNQSPTFQVTNENIALNPIQLSESIEELDEVVIEAERPVFEQTIDRMIVNVQSSPIMAGNTVLEVLEKSPGVVVNRQSSQVSMNGKSGVSVMINGKMTRIDMQILFNMLSNMPSDNIEKIELITTPPANFDAEGNAGFINLVLKKDDQQGTNGSVSGMIGRRTKRVFSLGGAINFRKNKFNTFADFNLVDNPHIISGNGSNVIKNEGYDFISTTSLEDHWETQLYTGRIGIDYYLTPKTVIGILGTINLMNEAGNGENHAYYGIEPGVDTLFYGTSDFAPFFKQYMYNINFQQVINDNQQLNIDLDYFTYYQSRPRTYYYSFMPENQQATILEKLDTKKMTPINIWVGKLDYQIDLSDQFFLEAGVKATLNDLENEVMAERYESGSWNIDPLFTSFTKMDEDIIAGYGSFNVNFDDKLNLKAGLRYEHTVTDIRDRQGVQWVYRKYGNFFPTAYLSRKLSELSNLNLAYSYRITRPTFSNLAPFIIFGDASTLWTGNPNLLPALTHSIKTNYSYKGINLSLSYDQISDRISRFQAKQIPNTNIIEFSSINIDKTTLWNLSLSLPVTVTSWWEMTNNFIGFSEHVTTMHNDENKDLSNITFQINSDQTFKLPKKFSIQLSGNYRSKKLHGLTIRAPNGMVSLGLRKELERNLGIFNLSFSDIFKTTNFNRIINTPESDYYATSDFYFDVQAVRLTYTNSFGNNKFKSRSKRQTGSADDLKRVQ